MKTKILLAILSLLFITFILPHFSFSLTQEQQKFYDECLRNEKNVLVAEMNKILEQINDPGKKKEVENILTIRLNEKIDEAKLVCRERSFIVLQLKELRDKYTQMLIENSTKAEEILGEMQAFVYYILSIFDKIYYEDIYLLDYSITIEGNKIKIKDQEYYVKGKETKSIILRKDNETINIKVTQKGIFLEESIATVKVNVPLKILNYDLYLKIGDSFNKINVMPLDVFYNFTKTYNKTLFDIINFEIVKRKGKALYKITFFESGKFLGFLTTKYKKSVYYDVGEMKLIGEKNPFFKFLIF